jgi:lysozyme
MILSSLGRALIQSFEECKLASYQDQHGVWTIGWGHTGPYIGPGMTCTQSEADTWFASDVLWAVEGVRRYTDVPLNQNQFDALTSFVFNVGVGGEEHSTLCKDLNASDYAGAAAQFLRWDHINGVVSAGLLRRRQAEQALFLLPAQSVSPESSL